MTFWRRISWLQGYRAGFKSRDVLAKGDVVEAKAKLDQQVRETKNIEKEFLIFKTTHKNRIAKAHELEKLNAHQLAKLKGLEAWITTHFQKVAQGQMSVVTTLEGKIAEMQTAQDEIRKILGDIYEGV